MMTTPNDFKKFLMGIYSGRTFQYLKAYYDHVLNVVRKGLKYDDHMLDTKKFMITQNIIKTQYKKVSGEVLSYEKFILLSFQAVYWDLNELYVRDNILEPSLRETGILTTLRYCYERNYQEYEHLVCPKRKCFK